MRPALSSHGVVARRIACNLGPSRRAVTLAVAVVAAAMTAPTSAAVPIFPGPAYDSITENGHDVQELPIRPGASAGDGIAIANTFRFENGAGRGARAIRWDASGAPPVELGTLGSSDTGYAESHVLAINSTGTAVGSSQLFSDDAFGTRAVRWDAGQTAATELGHLGASPFNFTTSRAVAINDAGTIAGHADKYDMAGNWLGTRAVRWDPGSTIAIELDNIGTGNDGVTETRPAAINASGTIFGQADKYDMAGNWLGIRAVRWEAGGTAATELDHFPTPQGNSIIHAANNAGTAAGYGDLYDGGIYRGRRAVRWEAGGTTMTVLDHLGTDGNNATSSEVNDINDAGTAVGYADRYDAGTSLGIRAVRWDAGGTAAVELADLGVDWAGRTYTVANAINNAGLIVGTANAYDDLNDLLGPRAVLWDTSGAAIDLNTLLPPDSGWINLSEAFDITDTNWVTGVGLFDSDGPGGADPYTRVFLMQVPEPAALAFLAAFVPFTRTLRRAMRA